MNFYVSAHFEQLKKELMHVTPEYLLQHGFTCPEWNADSYVSTLGTLHFKFTNGLTKVCWGLSEKDQPPQVISIIFDKTTLFSI